MLYVSVELRARRKKSGAIRPVRASWRARTVLLHVEDQEVGLPACFFSLFSPGQSGTTGWVQAHSGCPGQLGSG